MIFVLGVGSLVALVNAVVTALWDQFPQLKYWQIVLPTSVTFFLCGLIYVTPGGQWLVNLVDYFGATFIIFVLSIAELSGIFWIYGLQNFCDDLEFMLGKRPSAYWKICWGVITPVLLIAIFIYSIAMIQPLNYNGQKYPEGFIGELIYSKDLLRIKYKIPHFQWLDG